MDWLNINSKLYWSLQEPTWMHTSKLYLGLDNRFQSNPMNQNKNERLQKL